MRVLLIHNFYQQAGGEDTVFQQEIALLRENGVEVETLTFTNENFDGTLARKLSSAMRSLYNTHSAARTKQVIGQFRPDVVHIHNLFYTATAAVIRVAKQRAVPVVMTLHNYRLVCVNGLLMREGKVPCETCLTQLIPVAGIRHACFRKSHLQSAQLSLTTLLHKLTGIWRSVDRFVVLTAFARQKILTSSLHLLPTQVVVKPNFVPDVGYADPAKRQDYFLFIGRLSPEKGIRVMLEAAKKKSFNLRIIGDGPLRREVAQAATRLPQVAFTGWQDRSVVLAALKMCRALIVPSVWYEGLPTVILEAFATGTPIICSDQENLNQIVSDGQVGRLFKTGNSDDLSRVIDELSHHKPEQLAQYAQNSRQAYGKYSKESSYRATMSLYESLIIEKAALV
ncbi:glycosyltransferase [Spirosoma sp. HMF3257]|uniref:Glycosyltransferase family 1 protein n=2 Tax=Spirosoma telluris TaxID=2183553 RepID=A0A327NSJ3_9BACT|nr:glycosyltransferase [Spirosoma telluris]RAI78350.1 glycosyltransferase family 1 protein [Spirosoma telluris]